MEPNKSPTSSFNRKISNFVFQTNHIFKRGLKSETYIEPINQENGDIHKKDIDTQTNFNSETNMTIFRRKFETVQESGTQTSLTTFILAPKTSQSLSPDSLSPKQEHTLEGTMPVEKIEASSSKTAIVKSPRRDGLSFNRKNNLMRYLEGSEEQTNLDLLTGNTLTKTFLNKNRNKGKPVPSPSAVVQSKNNPQPLYNATTLKSHSYVYSPTNKNTAKDRPSRDLSRFKVVNVNEKEIQDDKIKPVRYFCQAPTPLNTANPSVDGHSTPTKAKRSLSFMSPTIASEKKDKSIEIKYIGKLIHPTRRGRSGSPKKLNKDVSDTDESKKVPYIDKSEVSFNDKFKVSGRSTDADESLEKQLHLDLRLSCEDVRTTYTAARSIASTTSTTESVLFQALSKLRDSDWTTSLLGLAELVDVTRNIDIDLVFPHMTSVNQKLIELIKSPRSHVTRTACQAVGHMLEYVKDTRRPEFDELIDTLLCKTADSNKFIRHDANLALDCMVTHIPTFHAIRSLCNKGPEHKNVLVRQATARLIVCAVVIAGPQNILHPHNNEYTRRRIILNLVKFLNDKNVEIRKFGERLYKLLYKDRIFEVYLKRYLEREVIMKIKKCIRQSPGLDL